MGRMFALSLLTLGLAVGSSGASNLPDGDWVEKSGTCEKQVSAPGPSQPDATQSAQKKAHREVIEFLRTRYPEIAWEPSLEFLRRVGVIPSNGTVQAVELPGVGTRQMVTLTVRITPAHVEEFKRQDNAFQSEQYVQEWQERRAARHRAWLKVLAGMTAFLVIGATYFRLEEATKGYYTTRLRAAALGSMALVAVVVGLLLW